MDNVIYHSRDLDGLMSAAIVHNIQTTHWEECKLFPFDYGELLDTRKFKGKSTVMVDVSMPMERMELLSQSCMEFVWIDHHVSAYRDLLKYCAEKEYPIETRKINDLISCLDIKKMNVTYYYSEKLSACEITSVVLSNDLGPTAKSIISLLGQYDTFRSFDDKKFTTDKDWDQVVVPFQYGMRAKFNDPERISDYLERINNLDKSKSQNTLILSDIYDLGFHIIEYQERIDHTNMVNNSFEMDFVFEGKTFKAICLNTGVFSSNVFKSIYYDGYHDIMIAFQYRGNTDKYKFSMYTTKDDVNILGIAKSFGGGGHAQACGFEIRAMDINIQKGMINIFNNKKADTSVSIGFLSFEDSTEEADDLLETATFTSFTSPTPTLIEVKEEVKVKEFKMPRGYLLRQDLDGNWYWIPMAHSKRFEESIQALTHVESPSHINSLSNFEKLFKDYRTNGPADLCPASLYPKLKDKL